MAEAASSLRRTPESHFFVSDRRTEKRDSGVRRNDGVWALALTALLLATPAAAQLKEPPKSYDRAIAAGYKALTLCSGIFNAGRTQAQVEALELTVIYPQYDAIVPTLEAKVTRGRDDRVAIVSVAYDPAMPPRAASWSVDRGCTIAPIGATLALPDDVPPASTRTAADAKPWPAGDAKATAKPKGDAKTLTAIVDSLFAEGYGKGTRTTGTVIVQDGRIVFERYRDGFGPHVSQRTWSVAKSLTGTIVGIGVGKGLLATGRTDAIPEWQGKGDPRAAIKLDQLLRMASGLHSDTAGNRTDALYFGGTSVTQEVTAWPLDAMPGTRFRYANNDIVLAMRALRARIGDDAGYGRFPQAELFDRIGMTRTIAETDFQGNFILSSQVWSTARDLARFGLLYQNDGVWNGERILPEGWVKYATTPSGPQPEGAFGYGATMWLLNKSPGVPADAFGAFGNRGQYVVIVPSRKIVIVRRGEDPAAPFDVAKYTADILAALQ
jgi:CubicO group peptidase (beta-lactamase class C family)